MKLHLDLLEQADHLAKRETKKPRQASLRRSASNAYYALFHLLCFEASAIMAPNLKDAARSQLQRAFGHDIMKQVCGKFLNVPLAASIASLTGTPVSNELRLVALAFIQLQEARHSADYDVGSDWNRAKARQYVQMATDAFSDWQQIRKSSEANVFLLSFLLIKQIESPR